MNPYMPVPVGQFKQFKLLAPPQPADMYNRTSKAAINKIMEPRRYQMDPTAHSFYRFLSLDRYWLGIRLTAATLPYPFSLFLLRILVVV